MALQKETYLLDSNIFMQSARHFYAFDIAPSFWKQLKEKGKKKDIISITGVREEILKGNDDLKEWIKICSCAFIDESEEDVQEKLSEIMEYVFGLNHYHSSAIAEFAEIVDSLLIAFACVNNYVLVTDERSEPKRKNKVKIPDICNAFKVRYINLYDMMRNLGIQL